MVNDPFEGMCSSNGVPQQLPAAVRDFQRQDSDSFENVLWMVQLYKLSSARYLQLICDFKTASDSFGGVV